MTDDAISDDAPEAATAPAERLLPSEADVAAVDVGVGGVAVAVGSSGIFGAAERAIEDVSGPSESACFHHAKLGQAPPLRHPGTHARMMTIETV